MPSAYETGKEVRSKLPDILSGNTLHERLRKEVSALGYSVDEKPWKTHIDRFSGKLRAARDPQRAAEHGLDPDSRNCLMEAYKYRAYPAEGADLSLFNEWGRRASFFWTAAVRQIQHALAANDLPRLNTLCSRKACEAYWDSLNQESDLTDLGWEVLKHLTAHKNSGGNFGAFHTDKSSLNKGNHAHQILVLTKGKG